MTLVLAPVRYENFSAYDSFATFRSAPHTGVYDETGLFFQVYSSATEDARNGFDETRMFEGRRSWKVTYRVTPNYVGGWNVVDPVSPFYADEGVYVRDRFELSATFDPTSEFTGNGLLVAAVQLTHPGTAYSGSDNIRVMLRNGRAWLVHYRADSDTNVSVTDIGSIDEWRGSQRQVVVAVLKTAVENVHRAIVLLGGAYDALEDLEVKADTTFTASGVTESLAYEVTREVWRWDWWFTRPESDAFQLWIYTTEWGEVTDVDGGAQIRLVETAKARTSREIPFLPPETQGRFDLYEDVDSWYAGLAISSFRSGGANFNNAYSYDTTRSYAPGMPALRIAYRSSPTTYALSRGTVLASRDKQFVRLVYELLEGFEAPAGAPFILASILLGTVSVGDRIQLRVNEDRVEICRFVQATSAVEDVVDLGPASDWCGSPMQLVLATWKLGDSSARARVWRGAAAASYTNLEFITQQVYTTSTTNPRVTSGAIGVTEYMTPTVTTAGPADDSLTAWIYVMQAGFIDESSDATEALTETVTRTVGVTSSMRVTRPETRTDAITVADVVARHYFAIAQYRASLEIGAAASPETTYGVAVASMLRALDATSGSAGVAVGEGVGLTPTALAYLGWAVTETCRVLTTVTPRMSYREMLTRALQIAETAHTAAGQTLMDPWALTAVLTRGYRAAVSAQESVAAGDATTYTVWIRAAVEDDVQVTPEMAVRAMLRGTLQEVLHVSAGLVLPGLDGGITWAINTRNGATTEYENFSLFNSFASRGAQYLGASRDGLFALHGDDDQGVDIVSRLRGGWMQFGGSRLTSLAGVYLGMHATGAIFVQLRTADGKHTTYRAVAQSMETTKVHVGKGWRARYFSFELVTTGQDFDLDTVEFVPMVGKRRV